VDLYEIPSEAINSMKSKTSAVDIPPILGIMKCHQITWSCQNVMYLRSLSCFSCPASEVCAHYNLGQVFLDPPKSKIPKTETVSKKRKIKLTVEEVYGTSSEDEQLDYKLDSDGKEDFAFKYVCSTDNLESQINCGSYVLVQYDVGKGKKTKSEQFIGICQSDQSQGEIEVMFLKSCSKDNSLFFVNEKDLVSVPLGQIKAFFPAPLVVLKGNRVFYKFKRCPKE